MKISWGALRTLTCIEPLIQALIASCIPSITSHHHHLDSPARLLLTSSSVWSVFHLPDHCYEESLSCLRSEPGRFVSEVFGLGKPSSISLWLSIIVLALSHATPVLFVFFIIGFNACFLTSLASFSVIARFSLSQPFLILPCVGLCIPPIK